MDHVVARYLPHVRGRDTTLWCAAVTGSANQHAISATTDGTKNAIVWVTNGTKVNAFDGETGASISTGGTGTYANVRQWTSPTTMRPPLEGWCRFAVGSAAMKDPLVRFGVAIDRSLLRELDALAHERGCTRSELFRDLGRAAVGRAKVPKRVDALGALTLVYDHHVRDLSERLTELQHQLGESVRCSLHVHLDQDLCLEVVVMHGRSDQLQLIADRILGMRGVKHGGIEIIAGLPAPGRSDHHHTEDHAHDHHHDHAHGLVSEGVPVPSVAARRRRGARPATSENASKRGSRGGRRARSGTGKPT